MAKFSDAANRDWKIELYFSDIAPLREIGLDLNTCKSDESAFAAIADLEVFGKVFWYLCEKQAKSAGISPEQFAAGFDGATMFAAADALVDAFVSFSLRPAVAKAAIQKLPAVRANADRKAIEKLEMITGSSDSGTSWPGSPESTPEG